MEYILRDIAFFSEPELVFHCAAHGVLSPRGFNVKSRDKNKARDDLSSQQYTMKGLREG